MSEINGLIEEIAEFAKVRDWERFHTPKNLAMALAGETGELVAEFQWLTPEESFVDLMPKEKLQDVELEIADVAIYLFRLVDKLGLDLGSAIRKKLNINETRFPSIP